MTTYGDLKPGDVFLQCDLGSPIYLVTDLPISNGRYWAANIITGEMMAFLRDMPVIKCTHPLLECLAEESR